MHFLYLYKFGCYQNFQLQSTIEKVPRGIRGEKSAASRQVCSKSTSQQVCSKSTSKVFLRIPYLVPALALSFFMLHVAI